MLFNPIKPWYLHQPEQILSSLADRLVPAGEDYVTKRLAWGVSIRVRRREVIGTGIIRNGVFELAVSEALWRLADPGEQALDIGANIGYMSSILGVRLGSAGKLWSFEPHPQLFGQLEGNAALFHRNPGFAELSLRQAALSDADGTAELHCPHDFASNEGVATLEPAAGAGAHHLVRTARADGLFPRERFGVVKLDVEGHESKVLHGAANLMAQGRIRDLVFEDHQGASSEVCQLLRACGYSLFQLGWKLRGPTLAPLSGPSVHSRYDAPSYLASLAPERAMQRMSPAGWQLLSRSRHGARLQ